MKNQETGLEIPLGVRISLAHAYFQKLLERNAIDALHIKGYAFGAEIYIEGRRSTDVDLFVRPAHVDRLLRVLVDEGWTIQAHFSTGSIFEHAATLYHPTWGLTDIHRMFPGLGPLGEATESFEYLWERKRKKRIANVFCWVPNLVDSRLLVILHAAKDKISHNPDIRFLQETLTDEEWSQIRLSACKTNSLIAYDTALGNIEKHAGDSEYLLWKSVSQPVGEHILWLARLKQAKGMRQKWFTLTSIFEVNVDHLAMELGHKPSQAEIQDKFFSRFVSLMKRK